jgi:hypothetical protein
MNRVLSLGFVMVALAGCTVTAERVPPKMLPDSGPALSYAELLIRARLQAGAATDAFYVNRWTDLEDVARGLEQTASFLTRATDVPPRHKDSLPVLAYALGKEAVNLREAAKVHEADKVNNCLQRIHLKVRELRLEN